MLLCFRFYVLVDGKVAFKGGEAPYNYKVEDVEKWLKSNGC